MSIDPKKILNETKKTTKEYGNIFNYLGLGLQLAFAVLFFFFIGKWLDNKFETTPYISIISMAVGMIGGFISFFKKAIELGKRADEK